MTTHVRVPVPTERTLLIGKILVGLATLAVLVYIAVLVYQQDDELAEAQGAISDQSEALATAKAKLDSHDKALDKANDRLEANDLPAVPVPTEAPSLGAPTTSPEPPSRGLRGERGPGPTRAQVAAAVATECADGCASLELLEAAVTRYCANNVCGTPGPSGTDGTPGPKGDQGDVGPGANDEQVLTQVAAYCAVNTCGTPGEQGEPGTAVPGEYLCPEGEWMFGLTVADDGAVTLSRGEVSLLP